MSLTVTINSGCPCCHAQPNTVGTLAHTAGCPMFPSITETPVVPYGARVAIARLRWKLHCLVADYRELGDLEEESLAAAEQVLRETEGF